MRFVGLTGGIASGKSTVSAMLRELGAQIIDADVVAREVVEPGQPALAEISARFKGVLGADGRLDRAKLCERIFNDEGEREALKAIINPRIQQAFRDKTRELERAGYDLVIYDAPLLIENRIHEWMNGVILVVAPREVQIARLVARNGLTREQAAARLSSQLPLEEKQQHATWIVDNAFDLAETRKQVERVWRAIQK